MSLSQEWEKMILQHIFKRGGPNANTGTGGLTASQNNLWVSLHSADPTDVHTTAQGNELVGGSYARATLPTDANVSTHTNWNAIDEPSGAQRITNKLDLNFPPATANWNSGNPIAFFGLWQIASGGGGEHYLGAGAISPSVIILNGNTFKFQGGSPGNMQFTVG